MRFFIETGADTPADAVQALQRMSAARVLPIVQRPPVSLLGLLLAPLRRMLPSQAPQRTVFPGHLREQALREYAMGHPQYLPQGDLPAEDPEWAAEVSMRDSPPRPMRHTETEVL